MKKKNKKASASKKPKEEAAKDDASETAAESVEATTPAGQATEDDKAIDDRPDDDEDDKPSDASPSSTPSLAQQSKLRSTSFRTGAGAGSPGAEGGGDTAPDIYRKHVARIEELEKENKRLTKESTDSDKRWKKAEEELADLREAEGDAPKDVDDTEKLVLCPIPPRRDLSIY